MTNSDSSNPLQLEIAVANGDQNTTATVDAIEEGIEVNAWIVIPWWWIEECQRLRSERMLITEDKTRDALEEVSRLLEERGITATASEIIKIIIQRDEFQAEIEKLRGELSESYKL